SFPTPEAYLATSRPTAIPRDSGSPARLLRQAAERTAPRPPRRARPDGAVPEHERPQPGRRLYAATRALPAGGKAHRVARLERRRPSAGRGRRGGDPPGRHLEGE